MKNEKPANETMLDRDDSWRSGMMFEIEDLFICEAGNHLANLKDKEKVKYLEQMIRRGKE